MTAYSTEVLVRVTTKDSHRPASLKLGVSGHLVADSPREAAQKAADLAGEKVKKELS